MKQYEYVIEKDFDIKKMLDIAADIVIKKIDDPSPVGLFEAYTGLAIRHGTFDNQIRFALYWTRIKKSWAVKYVALVQYTHKDPPYSLSIQGLESGSSAFVDFLRGAFIKQLKMGDFYGIARPQKGNHYD